MPRLARTGDTLGDVSYPQITKDELRQRLAALGYGGRELDRLITIWEQTGMTVDEILNPKWEDIDLEARLMRVPDLVSGLRPGRGVAAGAGVRA